MTVFPMNAHPCGTNKDGRLHGRQKQASTTTLCQKPVTVVDLDSPVGNGVCPTCHAESPGLDQALSMIAMQTHRVV